MKSGFQDHSPKISLIVLGTLCFVTLVMCQTRFRISKEVNHEIYPPVLRSRDYWFLYSIGNPDRFKCVLKAFIIVTSPLLSLVSTVLLLFGKVKSNPYLFIPWLFLTIKGLLFIQTDNIITILRDMSNKANYTLGFHLEDLKWLLFYTTIFFIDLIEAFSFCEIFDLFLVVWNHHPGYNSESATLEAVKRDIADIMEALSKCSLGSLSKISLSSAAESNENVHQIKKLTSRVKFSLKEDEKIYDENEPPRSLLKNNPILKNFMEELKNETTNCSEVIPGSETESPTKSQNEDLDDLYLMPSPEVNLNVFPKTGGINMGSETKDFIVGSV